MIQVILLLFAYGISAPGKRCEDYYAFLLFQTLVGSYDLHSGGANNSINPLAEDIGSGRQIAQNFKAVQYNYRHTGLFAVLATIEAHNQDEFTHNLAKRLKDIAKTTSNTHLQIAKNILKTSLTRQISCNKGLVEYMGDSLLSQREYKNLESVFTAIDAVTVKQFKASLKDRYDGVYPVIAAYGPVEDLPDYTFLSNRFGSLFA